MSEGDPRVKGQAEPGDAGYVAAENFCTAGDGNTTAPGRLPPLLRQPNATPTTAGATTEGTDPARERYPLAAGVTPPEGEAPSSGGEPGVRGQRAGGARTWCFGSPGELPHRKGQGGHGAGTLAPPCDTAQYHPGNNWSNCVHAHRRSRGWGERKRQARSTARIWKGVTSSDKWKRCRHESGDNLSTRERRAAPGPWRGRGRR